MVEHESTIKSNNHSEKKSATENVTKSATDEVTKSATMDYYDTRIGGVLEDATSPSGLQFAAALLSELLALYKVPEKKSIYLHKLKLGVVILHLATRTNDFKHLFQCYLKMINQLENENYSSHTINKIEEQVLKWCDSDTKFDSSILEIKEENDINNQPVTNGNLKIIYKRTKSKDNIDIDIQRKSRKKKKEVIKEELSDHVQNDIKNISDTENQEDEIELEEESPGLPCNQCDFKCFNGERNLDKHLFTAHNVGNQCPQCSLKFQEFTEYEKHTLMHVYHCEECNKPFAGIGGLRIHKRKHMPIYRRNLKVKSLTNASTTVACKICKEKIEKKLVASHIKEKHGSETMFNCENCNYTSWNRFYLKDHVKRVHFLQHISCTICGKVVKNLDKHIDRCHMTEGSHPCEQCGKLFAAKANLLTHIKNIHKQIKDYHCDQCTYSTYTKHNLRLHMKSHTGESSERECAICGKVTNSIQWHMNLFHKEEIRQTGVNESQPMTIDENNIT